MIKIHLASRSYATESLATRVAEVAVPIERVDAAIVGRVPDAIPTDLPGMPGAGRDLGSFGKSGFPGGKGGLPGDLGFGDLGGMPGGLGGMPGGLGGPGRGPPGGVKIPGADRMDGVEGFLGGYLDNTGNGLTGGFSGGGVTYGGYGVGVNGSGEPGVAKGGANGGSVTSAREGANDAKKAVGEGGSSRGGVPEGMDWSHGTRDSFKTEVQKTPAPAKAEPNDAGNTTNEQKAEPTQNEPEKEPETAVASNDTKKDGQAGRPNPFAMPTDDSTGGGTPRSAGSTHVMPTYDSSGGGTPRSAGAIGFADLWMPDPDGAGGGSPVSNVARVASKLRSV